MEPVRFWLNGALVEEHDASPTTTLLDYLRRTLRQTGTKEGCAEGDCGACTVAVLDTEGPSSARWRSVNACLVLLPMVHGRHLVTVEGLRRDGVYHPVQDALARAMGSQCGYCTPGVVMSMFEACYRDDLDEDWQVDDQMCGNLCRCTGYRPIREAAQAIAGLAPDDHFARLAASQVPPAPALSYEAHGQRFFAPRSLEALFDILDAHPDHRLVTGATDLGLDVTKRRKRFPCLVSLENLSDLRIIEARTDGLTLGAGLTLADLELVTRRLLPPLSRMLRYFGARQIKNRATLGGNLANASPIGDTAPVLLALDASVIARSRQGERVIPVDAFFEGYRKTALRPGEIIARVDFPSTPTDARVGVYKVSKRRELDISAVCAAMRVRVGDDGVITEARIAYGGMAATPSRAHRVEALLVGRPFEAVTFEAAAPAIADDFQPIDDHRGSAWYRRTVAQNLLRGFFEETRSARFRPLPEAPSSTVQVEVAS
ncbi:MAG: xanthine dehydrogenase small subunit [Deltaproteobacteria bacterium]|nr:xanthine dehydrogenase small subunit [Deltaproteobacteria bacterium]MCB9788494.1 xanthine dehydrogenase small subunit [Deltaproteobacteria bacterium]